MKRSFIVAIVSSTILLAFLLVLDPSTLPSFLLVVPFILMFVVLSLVFYEGLILLRFDRLTARKLAILCASLPVLLLVLQSVGQLTFRDVLVLFLLSVVAWFYIARTARS